MALAVNVDKKPMLPVVANAIKGIFHEPTTPFWTGRVMDLLFDGFDVDCSSQEFAAQATCSVLGSGDVQAIKIISEDLLKFSMLGGVSNQPYIMTKYIFDKEFSFRRMERLWVHTKFIVALKIFETLVV